MKDDYVRVPLRLFEMPGRLGGRFTPLMCWLDLVKFALECGSETIAITAKELCARWHLASNNSAIKNIALFEELGLIKVERSKSGNIITLAESAYCTTDCTTHCTTSDACNSIKDQQITTPEILPTAQRTAQPTAQRATKCVTEPLAESAYCTTDCTTQTVRNPDEKQEVPTTKILPTAQRTAQQPPSLHACARVLSPHNNEEREERREDVRQRASAGTCARTREAGRPQGEDRERAFAEELAQNETFIQTAAMRYKSDPIRVKAALADFFLEQIATGTVHDSASAYQRHAFNWLRYELQKTKANADNHTDQRPRRGETDDEFRARLLREVVEGEAARRRGDSDNTDLWP